MESISKFSQLFHNLYPIKIVLIFLSLLDLRLVIGLEVQTVNATLENIYSGNISGGVKHIFVYGISTSYVNVKIDSKFETDANNKISTITVKCNLDYIYDSDCPLMLTVMQGKSMTFLKIPETTKRLANVDRNITMQNYVERTICLDKETEEIHVEVSSCSKNFMKYNLSLQMRHDLQITVNSLVKTQISPTAPAVFYFPFPGSYFSAHFNPLNNIMRMNSVHEKREFLFIQLTSTSNHCMIMSVQQPKCPISDSVESITGNGQWQTLSVKTGMTIPIADFSQGFFLVFILLPDDSGCNHPSMGQPEVGSALTRESLSPSQLLRTKTFQFIIRDGMTTAEYHYALMIPLGLFLTFITIIFVIHLHFHKIRCDLYKIIEKNVRMTMDSAESVYTIDIRCEEGGRGRQKRQAPGSNGTMGSTDSIIRSRIQISELINSQPERLMIQSKRYYMAGLLVASFYCVPVFQLILSYHRRLMETGNFDLCYFNFLCSHMLGMFHDFNHIYSNIGYLICGPAFMFIVYLRQATVKKNSPSSEPKTPSTSNVELGLAIFENKGPLSKNWIPRAQWDISKGVFVHHGLFYAMGFSLFMTGVMSAAYHICPNQNNFQFDTAFMYTIAALGVVTIYQFRHPTYVSASMTFMTLAVVAASTVVGLLWESDKFRLFFTVSHSTFLLVILIYIHYVGYIRVNGVTITEWKPMFYILRQKWMDDIKSCKLVGFQKEIWSPRGDPKVVVLPGPCRLIFPIVVISVNSGALALIWTMMRNTNFASQVLAVYVVNCSVYSVYYSIMKMIHYECRGKLWLQPAIYLLASLILWTLSLSYFGDVVTAWERSPAESRARNVECTFLGFYDSHDVWHFISAAALFSSLMSLLTMDDDLIDRPKSEIPVF